MKQTIAQLAREAGIPIHTVYMRRQLGWSLEKALRTPVDKAKAKGAKTRSTWGERDSYGRLLNRRENNPRPWKELCPMNPNLNYQGWV